MKSFREKFKFVLFDNMRISDNERKIATFKFYSSLAKLDFLCYHSLCNNDTHKSRNGLGYYEKLRYKLCISLHLICALKTIHKTIIFLQLLFHDILLVLRFTSVMAMKRRLILKDMLPEQDELWKLEFLLLASILTQWHPIGINCHLQT